MNVRGDVYSKWTKVMSRHCFSHAQYELEMISSCCIWLIGQPSAMILGTVQTMYLISINLIPIAL